MDYAIVIGFVIGAVTATLAGLGIVPQSVGWAGATIAAIAGGCAASPPRGR